MSFKKCCKTCKYNSKPQSAASNICLLRKIIVHSEIASYAICHHWDHKESSFSIPDEKTINSDTQLDFDRELVIK
ncbi:MULTISPECIES: hypothetical protein [unclassified Prochlorococcus]|uniref:hypothetical protein n=1 Tax=unclassified Prochlorococcus TaxID=2627481 RepID=UPI0005338D51|nr:MULTISPECIES: hypothetical protein [unclassified Prochlorococcus]KGG16042.1 Metal-binding cluster containing protein [Prochlorococcus sp. MIT 0603]